MSLLRPLLPSSTAEHINPPDYRVSTITVKALVEDALPLEVGEAPIEVSLQRRAKDRRLADHGAAGRTCGGGTLQRDHWVTRADAALSKQLVIGQLRGVTEVNPGGKKIHRVGPFFSTRESGRVQL